MNMLRLRLHDVLLSYSCFQSRALLAVLKHLAAPHHNVLCQLPDLAHSTTGVAARYSRPRQQQQQQQYNHNLASNSSSCLQDAAPTSRWTPVRQLQLQHSFISSFGARQVEPAAGHNGALPLVGVEVGPQLYRGFAASAAKAADVSEQARSITRAIKAAQNLQQLQQILHDAGSSLNPIHAAAALNVAARLGRGAVAGAADAAAAAETQDSSCRNALQEAATEGLLSVLLPRWLAVLPQARPRELASVLYSASKLHCTNEQLWSATLAAFMQLDCVQQANAQDLSTIAYALATAGAAQQVPAAAGAPPASDASSIGPSSSSSSSSSTIVPGLAFDQVQLALQVVALQLAVLLSAADPAAADNCQSIVKVLWAHAKLGCAMGGQELTLLLQTLVQPALLQAADAQALSNTIWAVSELQQLPAWQQQHAEQRQAAALALQHVWPQLLDPLHLSKIARGSPQAVANSLLALGQLASGGRGQHVIAVPFAQRCALQLLVGPTAQKLDRWSAHDISTAISACGKLGCRAMAFVNAAAGAAEQWLPHTTARDLAEVAWACTRLRFKHEQLMADIMQHGRQLLHRTQGHGALLSAQDERTDLAATLSGAVAALKMTQLAGDVKALIASAAIKQQEKPLPANVARTLWRVHGWLLHEHPNAHGLTKLLTDAQQAACAEASRHTHRASPPAAVVTQQQQQRQQQQQQSQQQHL